MIPETQMREPGDLYPETDQEYRKLQSWCLDSWLAARNARTPHEERWDRYDKHYEAFIARKDGDWRSAVYMPEVFTQIETIKPKLIANLPNALCVPFGPEDVDPAKYMEQLLEWASKNSKLHYELFKVFHPVLVYGTGILKTFPDTTYAYGSEMQPIFHTETQLIRKPLIDPETQRQMLDLDRQPMFDEQSIQVDVPVGMQPVKKRYVAYDGPAARAVNPRNLWPAPDAEDVQSARYIIHRVYKPFPDIKRLVAEGVYRWPNGMSEKDFWEVRDDPRLTQMEAIDLSPGTDPTDRKVELLEIWTNDGPDSPGRVITLANRSHILRVHENPFWHGQKPFVRFVDYLRPHHFWGIGEVQHMEGIADAINALSNQRIDAGRMTMDPMYAVNINQLHDPNDLKTRPGGVIRTKGDGMRPGEVMEPVNRGDVPANAFVEVATLQQMGERTTAVSSYQRGDSPSRADTATTAAILDEAGASRFQLKATLFEIDPFADLYLHFGSILQQFTTTERKVRLLGPEGQVSFETVDPASLQGRFDYTVKSLSAMQSETVKRQQAVDVFREVVQGAQAGVIPPEVVKVAFIELMEAMGAKTVLKFLEQQPSLEQQVPELPPHLQVAQ